ncbi:MAG: SDR family oxidoreductase [Proteobacteria bacterium]|nr:SDR family oxidoreductase [Pseudomonadota bacterium]
MADGLIVTGGGRGIGAATARLAAQRGYAVCVNFAHNQAAAEAVVDDIKKGGGTAFAAQGDVAKERDVARLFDAAEREFGPVRYLVNNAGITGRIGKFTDLEADVMRGVFDTNVIGSLLCAREAVRRLTARGATGAIVNVSSTAATTGSPGEYVHYAASKAAVDSFTIGLAREIATQGIRVNAVAPGATLTDIHAAGGEPGRPDRVKGRIPMGRLAEPDEIAPAILWLLSDEASYVTGAILRAGGGF